MKLDVSQIPLIGWVGLVILLFAQSSWLFLDAQKKNATPWFWGIWGLIQFPCPLILYLIIVRKIFKRRKK